MKAIFLDIDGVMNYTGGDTVTPEDIHFVEDEKLILLKEIVDATGAYLILSSSWRFGWREADRGRDTSIFSRNYFRLRDKFHEHGMAFFSKTPILKGFSREVEIQYWLSSWENDEIESFVILDDEEYEYQDLRNMLIQTKRDEGLRKEHVIQAIGILGPKKITGGHMISRETLQRVGINYGKGLTYFGKDEEMYQKYLWDFSQENYTDMAIACLHNKDVQGAFKAVHSLKSLIEYVCIPSIDEIVHEITETLRAGKTEGVMDGLVFIKTATEEMKKEIINGNK